MKHQELMCFASILQCKGYINYILLIWSVSSPELSSSCARFSMANTNIKLKWPNSPGAVDAYNQAKFNQHQQYIVNFLDLNIQITCLQTQCRVCLWSTANPAAPLCTYPVDPITCYMFFKDGSRQGCIDCEHTLSTLQSG